MTTDHVATLCFGLAVAHTFTTGRWRAWAHRRPAGSWARKILHSLGEVELTFGLWAGVFLIYLWLDNGFRPSFGYVASLSFAEPTFVFVVMMVCSTEPILALARRFIDRVARRLPGPRSIASYAATMTIGPLLGSLVTEPAAMTITALILSERVFARPTSPSFRYATLGLLFVNVSIGGLLTPYAAAPVLMVAKAWRWDLGFVLREFGVRALIAILLSTLTVIAIHRRELGRLAWAPRSAEATTQAWLTALHVIFLVAIVSSAHHPIVFGGLGLGFLALVRLTRSEQLGRIVREPALVMIFLGGLVVLGPGQGWWIAPALASFSDGALYFGAMALTAVCDNAALAYLGAQAPTLSAASRYALVAGAVVGGGLTVIANAPNPAGYGILNPAFGPDGIRAGRLFRSALIPTLIAAVCFYAWH